MADGALRAPNGAHQLALAAQHFSVPVIVCAALYKLSPTHLCSYDQDAFNKIIGPETMLNFSNTKLHSKVCFNLNYVGCFKISEYSNTSSIS